MNEIGIKLALDGAAKVQAELKGVEAGFGRLSSSMKTVAASAGSFAASLGLGISVGKLVQVQREFDVLNASLKTVTGSGAAAAREMAWLKDFAKETPFGLAQATQGFVKMKALGLDPTRAALTSFGNTASAMGKDLNQMIEAVADASTGEFERLKEFGIKAKKEGDNVSLTFQGVTTTIKNSSSEITKYLEDIGNVQFGGAMAERAKTLDGAISELGDTWDELFRTINERNAGTLIYDSVKLANGAIEDATTIIKAMTAAYDENGQATGAMATIQNGIATVFETVAVLGANLKYVLVQIGTEIGGLAAQVTQAAQFNFSGVAAIREQMVADAEEARRQIDATTARILGARKAQEEYARYATRNASAATDPRRIDLGKPTASGKPTGRTDTSINAANKALQDQAKLLAELSGLSGSFAADWQLLTTAYQSGKLSLDGLTAAQAALLEKQPAIKAASDEEKKAQELLTQSYQDAAAERLKNVESMEKSADGLVSQNQALRDEIELIGLSEEQQTRVLQMRNEAIILTKEATLAELERANAITGTMTREQIALAAEIEALKERNELLGAKSVKNTAAEAAKKAEDEWKKTTDQINESLTDALMRGFESGKDFAKNMRDTVVNMFKTMVLRPTISAILAPVAGGVTGLLGLSGAANAGQGAGSLMGMASNASSAYNLVIGGLNVASQAGTWLSGKGTELALQYMGESAGTLLNNFALGMSSTSSMSAASAALQGVGADIAGLAVGSVLNGFSGYGISSALSGGYSAGGWVNTVAGIASAIPGVGPIAGVIGGAANRLFGRKLKDAGIEGTFGGETGFEGNSFEYYKGGLFRSNKTKRSPLDEETRSALADNFNVMRVATAAMADVLGLGTDAISNFTASVKISLKGLSPEDAEKAIQAEFDKIAESLARQTLGTDAFSRAGESSVQTLTRLSSSLTTVNSAFKMLDIEARDLQFANSLTGGKNASEYLDKFGGAYVFNQLTASYYDAFYSEAEKTANVTKSITETLASVGLAMPTTREAFRDLTNEYLAMGIYGAETAAVLLGLSGAFAAIVPATEAVTESIGGVTESVKAMTASLDDYISSNVRDSAQARYLRGLEMVGNTAALKRLGVPGYASGGYHSGGLRLVGENGPELEVTGPANIISNPVTSALLSGRGGDGATVAELKGLRAELQSEIKNLRAEVRAVVVQTAKAADIWERVTPGRNSISIATPYGPVQVATPAGKPLSVDQVT